MFWGRFIFNWLNFFNYCLGLNFMFWTVSAMSTIDPTALSTEEIDDLERSNKKVKDAELFRSMEEDEDPSSHSKVSYKEKLVYSNTPSFSLNFASTLVKVVYFRKRRTF